MRLSVILSWALSQAPVDDAGQRYAAAIAEVEAADDWSDKHDGRDVAERLERAIEDALQFGPELIADADGRESLLYARLSLARNYYIMDPPDPAAGDAIIASVLRTTFDVSPKVLARFTPYFGDAVERQRARLDAEGMATIEVVCHVACEVAINLQPVQPGPTDVYLGSHEVVVRASDDSIEPLQRSLSFSRSGQLEVVEFGPEPEPEPELEPPPPVCPPAPVIAAPIDTGPKRMLPRWQEVGGVIAGAGLLAGGGVMLALDGNQACPKTADGCDWLWEFTPGGAIMLSIGGAVLISSVALLAVDERRVRANKHKHARIRALGVMEF